MTELESKILSAAQKYYTDGTSEYSDEEFDALVEQLRRENPNSDLFKTGWGYSVSNDTTPGEKVKHKYGRAGSLEKCHNWNEIGLLLQRGPVDVSLKLDGLSCVLYFESSKLVRALTRGDGEIGIDITDKIRKIFPEVADEDNFTGAIRGEILMSLHSFEKWSSIHTDAKNPRNSAAGIINSKTATDEDLKYLRLIVYTIVGDENLQNNLNSEKYSVEIIRQRLINMFGEERVVPHFRYDTGILNADNFDSHMGQLKNWMYGTYPADGLVLTYGYLPEDLSTLPEVTYFAKAYKFPAESKVTTVKEVIWNMSKTRYAVPKVWIEPVQLAGTTVEFATAYNARWILDNNIGPGAVVEVQKAGEIIPQITRVVSTGAVELGMIRHCPDCGCALTWSGVHLKCDNPNCSNAILQDTLIWMENIAPRDGLGDLIKQKFLNQMLDGGVIKDLSVESIMKTNLHLPEDTASIQQNEFAKMWNSLHTCKVSAVKAILALNLPRIGGITAMKFSARMDLLWEVFDAVESNLDHIPLSTSAILGGVIGMSNAASVESNMWKVSRLKYLKDRIQEPVRVGASKGKVAITGKLSVHCIFLFRN